MSTVQAAVCTATEGMDDSTVIDSSQIDVSSGQHAERLRQSSTIPWSPDALDEAPSVAVTLRRDGEAVYLHELHFPVLEDVNEVKFSIRTHESAPWETVDTMTSESLQRNGKTITLATGSQAAVIKLEFIPAVDDDGAVIPVKVQLEIKACFMASFLPTSSFPFESSAASCIYEDGIADNFPFLITTFVCLHLPPISFQACAHAQSLTICCQFHLELLPPLGLIPLLLGLPHWALSTFMCPLGTLPSHCSTFLSSRLKIWITSPLPRRNSPAELMSVPSYLTYFHLFHVYVLPLVIRIFHFFRFLAQAMLPPLSLHVIYPILMSLSILRIVAMRFKRSCRLLGVSLSLKPQLHATAPPGLPSSVLPLLVLVLHSSSLGVHDFVHLID